MVKILSRSGASLADVYDVEGSIAGIEQLETRELPIVHEMGATVLSERFTTRIFRIPTGAIAQDVSFRVELATLPETPARLLGIQVIADNLARILRLAVVVHDPTVGQDMPVWISDASVALAESVILEDAGASATFDLAIPIFIPGMFPTFVGGREQQDNMVSSLVLVGRSTGFGAGSVSATALCYLAFPRRDGSVSSKGLPIPSW